MITVSGRDVNVPCEEKFIGFEGDNAVHSVIIKVLNTELADFDFKIDVMQREKNIAEPIKENLNDGVLLTWIIKKEHIQRGGIVSVQVRAFSGEELVWHSNIFELMAKTSINATKVFPSPLPNEFEEIERRITEIKNATERIVKDVSASEENARAFSQSAGESASDAESAREGCEAIKEGIEVTAGKVEDARQAADAAAEKAGAAVGKTSYIGENGNWFEWDGEKFRDSGVSARGSNGKDGANGIDGEDGADGKDGYTPQKGIDYFTDAEKAEFVAEVTENITPTLKRKADVSYVDTAIQTAIGDVLGGVS